MYFLILGKGTSETAFTYAGLQVDTGVLYTLQGKEAPAKSRVSQQFS